VIALGLVAAALLQASAAQAPPPPAPTAAPPASLQSAQAQVAKLDALLDARDYRRLREQVESVATRAEFDTMLVWLRDRSSQGRSAFVSWLYMQGLFSLNEALNPGKDGALLDTAALALLGGLVLVKSDGAYCADPSAVTNRTTQCMAAGPRLLPRLQALPEALRQQLLGSILNMEASAAAARPADGDAPFVCTGGLADISAGLAAGAVREVPNQPGTFGRSFAVTPPDVAPKTVPEVVRRERQAKLRAELPTYLAQLLKLPSTP